MKVFIRDINHVYKIDTKLDLKSFISNVEDILNIDNVYIKGEIVDNYGLFELNINIKANLELTSARSHKSVPYSLDFDLELLFGDTKSADYKLEQSINLDEIVFGHILIEKPLTIYADDETEIEIPREKNPAFSALEDFKK